ncbi:hypothetical protein GCM10022280_15810 [Sphingomonas swuensis]|uniref:Lipoprotein n=1 Tax=Sphingomonas swuensis TaxID=977800 RepID=A0ABP7SWZ8_9SPHN
MCSSRRIIAAAAGALALAGCAQTTDRRTGSVDPQFGEAVAWNKAVQTVDPAPSYAATDTKPGSAGDKAAAAARRYRTDQVKAIEQVRSTQGSGGGGSGPQ